jgi:hypothetical protein
MIQTESLPPKPRRLHSWQGSCLGNMRDYGNYRDYMNSSGHLTVSETAARRVKKTKGQKRGRPRTRNGKGRNAEGKVDPATTMAAAGTLTRTKALLLAALRVWELKHRIHDQE